MKTIIYSLFLIFNFLVASATADIDPSSWSYTGKTGPDYWSKLDSSYRTCAIGKLQSPIDVKHTKPQRQNLLQLEYHPAPLQIIDDGLTTLNIEGRKTIVNTGHTLQLNFPENGPIETLSLAGSKYHLIQFHFHMPSENLINGTKYPLEIHFVHQNKHGEVVVAAVFVKEGQTNSTLEKILNNLPEKEKVLKIAKDVDIEPTDLTPKNHAYYGFDGSLTTPPCSEYVDWILMKDPIEASSMQIEQLRKAIGAENARPVQPLNNRVIYEFGDNQN